MGMFDKDKVFARDGAIRNWIAEDQEFILRDIEYKGMVPTPDGPEDEAPMVHLTVSKMDETDKVSIVSMIGDRIKEKAEQKEDGDLPAICITKTVENKKPGQNPAFVLQFSRPYDPTKDDEVPFD